jgi:hypothetical protein
MLNVINSEQEITFQRALLFLLCWASTKCPSLIPCDLSTNKILLSYFCLSWGDGGLGQGQTWWAWLIVQEGCLYCKIWQRRKAAIMEHDKVNWLMENCHYSPTDMGHQHSQLTEHHTGFVNGLAEGILSIPGTYFRHCGIGAIHHIFTEHLF